MTVDAVSLLGLVLFAFLAGALDAMVGGGGLIQLPATVLLLPAGMPAVVALGTSKLASLCGTAVAAVTYYRRMPPDSAVVTPLTAAAFAGSFLGARLATALPPEALEPVILALLPAVAVFTWRRPELGSTTRARLAARTQLVAAALLGAGVGAYDGFFGPGTGTFLILGLITIVGLDFLHASAAAKIANTATNLAALIVFAAAGAVLWPEGAVMAAANVGGSVVGARLALRYGNRFVRGVFLVVVSALIARLAYDVLVAR